jgi:hypothetical protein
MDWDDNSVEIPKLFSKNSSDVIVNPRFEVFLDTHPNKTYALTFDEMDANKNDTNFLIEFVMTSILEEEDYPGTIDEISDHAFFLCMKNKPILIVIDHDLGTQFVAPYDIYH